jgi:hypothetical protein
MHVILDIVHFHQMAFVILQNSAAEGVQLPIGLVRQSSRAMLRAVDQMHEQFGQRLSHGVLP